jgi:tRNA(fMet)-specific endonuclease VapC
VKYVLDTNAFSALMQGRPETIDRLAAVGREEVSVPQPVLAEIAYGIERLPPSRRRTALQTRFDLLRSQFVRCPWTDEVSEAFGRIKAVLEKRGQRIEDFDVAIAAHAAATGATLVTASARQMARVPGLLIEDWK